MTGACIRVEVPIVPYIASVDLPTLPVTDTWVSFPAGLAVGTQGALSLIHNFAAPADCAIG